MMSDAPMNRAGRLHAGVAENRARRGCCERAVDEDEYTMNDR
jgi:hypothetical protein